MRRTLIIVLVVVMTVMCLQYSALAATVNYDGSDNVTSVEGLTIGVGTYNVDFFWGTYDEIFGHLGYDFNTKDVADDAINVLNLCLYSYSPGQRVG